MTLHPTPTPWSTAHLRLEVLVNENVIAIQLKAVLIADDHLLHALQALDEDVVHVTEERLHGLSPMLGGQVLPEALKIPLAALRPRQSGGRGAQFIGAHRMALE